MINEIPDSAIPGRLRVSGKYFRLDDEDPPCLIKAVTFGPFPAGHLAGDVRAELERIKRELGANAVRFYEPPPMTWLNDCAEFGLFAFVTISWNQQVDFLSQKQIRRETEIRVRDVVERYRGHPAVAGYFVGNEIESILVRYLGPKKVVHFLEDLIEIGRAHDPDVLFSYASHPSTEYLIPENQDFLAMNLYLEDPGYFVDYLDRLQNLAGNFPVIISECGADSRKTGQDGQAEILSSQISEVCRAGLAGMMIFSWCDQWGQGGETLRQWEFGITGREGEAKPAFHAVAKKWQAIEKPADGLEIEIWPFFSVIICTHRGARRLKQALASLEKLDYPRFEIVVVNDGNDDDVRELTQPREDVRHVGIPRAGLAAARNLGAKTANGEILVYLDDDCEVEADWLKWFAHAFHTAEKPDCVGGPNIPPPPLNVEQACIAAAPGGAAHVLIRERLAEQVPGCNLAVKRLAFDTVGGFNEKFKAAGDDVDFCWRLLEAGFKIHLHSGAFVWHHRRPDLASYLRQQAGYGRAEGMMKSLHPEKFAGIDGLRWRGCVYEGPPLTFSRSNQTVSHGLFGREPIQTTQPVNGHGSGSVFTHVAWVFSVFVVGMFGFFVPSLILVGGIGLCATALSALRTAFRSQVPRRFDSLWARLYLAWLVLAQGLTRSFARMSQSNSIQPIRFFRQIFQAILSAPWPKPSNSLVLRFRSENNHAGRKELLDVFEGMEHFKRKDRNGAVDFFLGHGLFFRTELTTATEYHDRDHRVTLAKIRFRLNVSIFLITMFACLFMGKLVDNPWWIPMGFFGVVMIEWVLTALRHTNRVGTAASLAGLRIFQG